MSDEETEENTSFRLQNKRVHLTYKSHIPHEAWLSWFNSVKKKTISFYSIVHESSDENHPYDHTHVAIEFEKQFQTRNSRFFDWELPDKSKIHPHIKPIKTKKHWYNCLEYHYKENKPFTNVERPLNKSEIEEIWKHDSLKKALLSTCVTLNNVGGVIAAFNCKPSDYGIEPDVNWKPWQKELSEELSKSPDPRKILWHFDPLGNNGKSFFAKHFGMYKGAFVSTKANTYHIATALDEYIKTNGQDSILVVIFNFTRQQENHKIYQALEELKDGMVTSEKYKGRTMYFNVPHLVCFANYLPEVETLTKDRWDIRVLQNDKVVRRYTHEKTFSTNDPIDPLIKYKLSHIEEFFQSNDCSTGVSLLNITEGNAAPLTEALPPQVPPSAPHKKFQSLASLDSEAAPPQNIRAPPSAPQEISGQWENNIFTPNNPLLRPLPLRLQYGDAIYEGHWEQGKFIATRLIK